MKIVNSTKEFVDIRFTKEEYANFEKLLSLEQTVMFELIGFDPRVHEEPLDLHKGFKFKTTAGAIIESE